MGCVSIIKESCIYCEKDYSQELKYCPNCGSRNSKYIESDQLINEIKIDIENNNYFKSRAKKEIEKITKNMGDTFYHSSEFKSVEGTSSHVDDSKEDSGIGAGSGFSGSKGSSGVDASSSFNPKNSSNIICPKCAQKNDKSSNFCIKCGLDLKNMMVCPKCGEINSFGKFCTNCGTPLKK